MGGRGAGAGLIAALAVALAPGHAQAGENALRAYAPEVRYDRTEDLHATSIETMLRRPGTRLIAADGRVPAGGGPAGLAAADLARGPRTAGQHIASRRGPGLGPAVVYGRGVRGRDGLTRLQYWLFYEDNPQDRGIVRSGRHAGDWEMVQLTLGVNGRPQRVTAAQHSWAERCGWSQTTRRGDRLVLYPAAGSHATYLAPGDVDRPLGDPIDHARGDGRRERPAVRVIDAASPRWMRWRGRWGAARAGILPVEQSSPRGPAWQGRSWEDPAAFERSARPCGSGPPGRPWVTAALVTLGLLATGLVVTATRRAMRWPAT